jgi:hypothetical protein
MRLLTALIAFVMMLFFCIFRATTVNVPELVVIKVKVSASASFRSAADLLHSRAGVCWAD